MARGIWERKMHPTVAGQCVAIAKGVFLTGEPLVERAEYLLRFPGSRERVLELYRKVANSDVTDRVYEKFTNARDPEIRVILARGYMRAFEKAIDDHENDERLIESAGGVLYHWKIRRDYLDHVEEQTRTFAQRFWEPEEVQEIMRQVHDRCMELKRDNRLVVATA